MTAALYSEQDHSLSHFDVKINFFLPPEECSGGWMLYLQGEVCVWGGGGKVRWAVYVFTILGSLRYESIQTRVETLIKSKV